MILDEFHLVCYVSMYGYIQFALNFLMDYKSNFIWKIVIYYNSTSEQNN